MGAEPVTGRQAVIDACEATLAELAGGSAELVRFDVGTAGTASPSTR